MLGQTFSFSDIPRVAILAFLEILLSADNAIVLGLIVSKLSSSLRNRALFIGLLSAWIFRLVGMLGFVFLLEYLWVQFIGGVYLLYLSVDHFIKTKKKDPLLPSPASSFWKTVLFIELIDLAFAVDSIVAGIAFITTSNQILYSKIWIVYLGGMIGVLAIRFAAKTFSSIIHLYPRLQSAAHLMVGWIGLKLISTAFSFQFPYFDLIFWMVLGALFIFGLTRRSHV